MDFTVTAFPLHFDPNPNVRIGQGGGLDYLVARPINSSLRSDILGTFDRQPICSIKQVIEMLSEAPEYETPPSYNSVHRMLNKMVKENLIMEIPGSRQHNQRFFTKTMFNKSTRFADPLGNNVSLKEFIHTLASYENEVVNPIALNAIKAWMFDSLASSIPEAYVNNDKPIPDPKQLARKLNKTLAMLSQLHRFISSFVNTPVDPERLAHEFNTLCVEEHAAIVDRTWLNDQGKSSE